LFAPSVLWRQKGFTFMRRKSILGANTLQLETERIIIRDSAFNFNTGSFTQRLSSVVKTWSAERLIEVRPKVKDEGGVVNRYWPTYSPPQNPKTGGAKGGEIIREVILPYLDRQIATAEKKVSIPERS
jgi:hypothetical protein